MKTITVRVNNRLIPTEAVTACPVSFLLNGAAAATAVSKNTNATGRRRVQCRHLSGRRLCTDHPIRGSNYRACRTRYGCWKHRYPPFQTSLSKCHDPVGNSDFGGCP